MSQHIFLVKYESDNSGNLYEEEVSTIKSAFISTQLLEKITNQYPLIEINILEEKEADDFFKIDCFSNDEIQDICTFLENLFIRLYEDNKKNDSSSETIIAPSQVILKEDLNILIEKFRTITNLIHLLRLKMDKYESDNSAIVKLG